MSTVIAFLSGGILGYVAVGAGRRIFETPDHPTLGIVLGWVIGIIVVLNYGVIQIPGPDTSSLWFYRTPVIYGAAIGHRIGTILFPLIGIRGIIFEAMETRKRIKANAESKNDLSFYKSRKTDENR